jgi:hypothetical protein
VGVFACTEVRLAARCPRTHAHAVAQTAARCARADADGSVARNEASACVRVLLLGGAAAGEAWSRAYAHAEARPAARHARTYTHMEARPAAKRVCVRAEERQAAMRAHV